MKQKSTTFSYESWIDVHNQCLRMIEKGYTIVSIGGSDGIAVIIYLEPVVPQQDNNCSTCYYFETQVDKQPCKACLPFGDYPSWTIVPD